MQNQITYYIGLGSDGVGKKIHPQRARVLASLLRTYACEHMGGGTFLPGTGFWSDNGIQITEPVLVIVTDTTDGLVEAKAHAQALASIADQKCVHVSIHEVYAVDYTADGKVR